MNEALLENIRKFTASKKVVFITAKQISRPYSGAVPPQFKGPIIIDYLTMLGK
jgi:hypothetical protein